jgi:hypothetical protein
VERIVYEKKPCNYYEIITAHKDELRKYQGNQTQDSHRPNSSLAVHPTNHPNYLQGA